MLQIDNTIISLNLLEECFVCDLSWCKGICCVEGDAGAPLEKAEIETLEKILPEVWDDLPKASQKVIKKQGVYYIDDDGEPVTSIVGNQECVFAYQEKTGIWKCAIEKAYREGRIDFYKPISCHLYPIRLQKYKELTAVNVHRWSVCECARVRGKNLNVPVYQFLKEPLIRRFGKEWYEQLEIAAKEFNSSEF
ncbi:MAG TPA: DUF3109 family protein [Bacteroidales bacterium]|nr:DUF3109 family protein [Bacteroidales bacterium]